MMRHPMLWGFVLGAGAYYVYDHYFHTPKMPVGKYGRGGGAG